MATFGTNFWGDGNNQYVTIGAGGAAGIMFYNPHVVWQAGENRASIRMGRSGGLVEFQFSYMDVRFSANTRQIQSGPIVQISGEVGPLPYSAEGIEIRRSTMAIIDASQSLDHTRLAISSGITLPDAHTRSQPVHAWRQHPGGPDKHTPAVFAIGA